MINSGKEIIKTTLYPLVLLFLLTMGATFFAVIQTQKARHLESEGMLLQQFFKFSNEAFLTRNIIEIDRNMQALIGDLMYIRLTQDGNFDIQFPKDYFSSIWQTPATFLFDHKLSTGQIIHVKAWTMKKNHDPNLYVLYATLTLIGLFVFAIAFRNIRRWESDLKSTAALLYGQDKLQSEPKLFYKFFSRVVEFAKQARENEHNLILTTEVANIAAQVSHDIRSPLAALNIAVADLKEIPEDRRSIIHGALRLIGDIANNLLEKNYEKLISSAKNFSSHGPHDLNENRISVFMVSSFIDSVISAKRLQYKKRPGLVIASEFRNLYGTFIKADLTEAKRVLSNLVDNSVDALKDSGSVLIEVTKSANDVMLKIIDNGQGIPADILPELMQRGKSFGKEKGSGLGLFHAKTSVEKWGGAISIESQQGRGTVVTIIFPRAKPPAWFIEKIELKKEMTIVVADDDPSIHGVWEQRLRPFAENGAGFSIIHVSSPEKLLEWHKNNGSTNQNICFFMDYHFSGASSTGLDLIEDLDVGDKSVLVTSRFEESDLQRKCLSLQTKLLPKGLAGEIPMNMLMAE